MRLILGVVDGDEFPAREGQREGERLGLGARFRGGHHDHFIGHRARPRPSRRDRLEIVGLDDQLDVQAITRPVDAVERRDQFGNEIGLAEQRHKDGVDGQVVVPTIELGAQRPTGGEAGGDEAQDRDAEKEHCPDQVHGNQGGRRQNVDGKRDEGGDGGTGRDLCASGYVPGREIGMERRQAAEGVGDVILTADAHEGGTDRRRRRHAKSLTGCRIGGKPMGDVGHRLFPRSNEGDAVRAGRFREAPVADRLDLGNGTGIEPDLGDEGQAKTTRPLGVGGRRFIDVEASVIGPAGRIEARHIPLQRPAYPRARRSRRVIVSRIRAVREASICR